MEEEAERDREGSEKEIFLIEDSCGRVAGDVECAGADVRRGMPFMNALEVEETTLSSLLFRLPSGTPARPESKMLLTDNDDDAEMFFALRCISGTSSPLGPK